MNLDYSVYLALIHIGETNLLDNKEKILKFFPIGSTDAWQLYNDKLITDQTPTSDPNAIELVKASNIVEAYEKEHYPIATDR